MTESKKILLFLMLCFNFVSGQSFQSIYLNSGAEIPLLSFDKPSDIDELLNEEIVKGQIFNFGKFVLCDINSDTKGSWTNVEDGKVWTLAIQAEEAKGISLYYDNFWIPSGGELYIYNPSQSQKIGPFTSKNNPASGVYATEIIYGDILILEYFQPNITNNKLNLSINKFVYAYRDIISGQLGGYNSSEDCQVNANCSEGNSWENQKKSVCRIQIGSGWNVGLCTGALINNTLNDCTPYVLSADHCFDGGDISENDLNQTIFYFNYYSDSCQNLIPNNYNSITGCSYVSNSGGEGIVGDSDFFLVELNSNPDFDPYFSGWDRSNISASNGVSIHHPSGDVMKISTFTNGLSSTSGLGFGFDNTTHWQVQWSQTDNGHGVTEGGSSGSPIYNQNSLLVGVLTGGSSYCDATNQTDIYGKLWHGWDQMGNSNTEQLKPWLDPTNFGSISVNGIFCESLNNLIADFECANSEICINNSVVFSSSSIGTIDSYEWSFQGGQPSSAIGPGPHIINYDAVGDFDVSLIVNNNEFSDTIIQYNYINVISNTVELDFLPDCYGEEISWVLKDENNEILYSALNGYYNGGGSSTTMEPNPISVVEVWCLPIGCYEFIVEDEYGDGLFGSQYSCEYDGDFTIYDNYGNILTALNEPNSDFGNNITLEFCVQSINIACDITPSELFVDNIIHNRVNFNWSQPEVSPSHYMIRYRPVGTSSWTVMTAGPVNNNPFNGTSRTRYFMEPETTYEWNIRARVLNEDGSTNCQSPWSASSQFTTLPACPNLENLSVFTEANWVTLNADAAGEEWGVWQSKAKMKELGTNSFRYANGDSYGNINVLKGNFSPNTEYQWHTKAWCTGNVDELGNSDPQYHSGWGDFSYFITEEICNKMPVNLSTSSNGANTAITMSWDLPLSGTPDHYFLELNNENTGQQWLWNNIPGSQTSKSKFGLTVGDYSWRIRGACGTNGTTWATIFSEPVYYTLGGARLDNDIVSDLNVYPNPSRDLFNISFSSDELQSISIRVVNVIGEEIFKQELIDFDGTYTHELDMSKKSKGVYFLEISSEKGTVNSKMVLQ